MPWSGARQLRGTLAVAGASLLLGGCEVLDRGFLNAQGPVAEHERFFFLVVCAVLVFVAAPVMILTPLIAWRYRLGNRGRIYRPDWHFSWLLEGFIWIPPVGIVILLGFLLWPATKRDDPYTRLAERGTPLRVQAIGLDWKWVFVLPDQGIATVNHLPVPAGRPVQVELTSGTVMQSMLLPQLAGQIYAMGGMSTKLNFSADKPGTYLGLNTQFNGAGFARQKFDVEAMTAEAWDAWVARARAESKPLDDAAWRTISARSVLPEPLTFSQVPPDLFVRVVAETGGRSHTHAHVTDRK